MLGTRACCLNRAVPIAMKAGAPGTPEFRGALRDALESTKNFADSNGLVNMTRTIISVSINVLA